VLQVNTGRFYGPDDVVEETPFEIDIHTNTCLEQPSDIDVAGYRLRYPGGLADTSVATVSGTERLGNLTPAGSTFGVKSYGGQQIVDDLCTVLSVVLDATFTTDANEMAGLVIEAMKSGPRQVLIGPRLARRIVTTDALMAASVLIEKLVTLSRTEYEAAMRAMRAVNRAIAGRDREPTLAYALHVFALETLAQQWAPEITAWAQMPKRIRDAVDSALDGVDGGDADRIRAALVGAELPGSLQSIPALVREKVARSFYRDADAGLLPVRASELDRAVERAYEIRSGTAHELADLRPEEWVVTGGFDTVRPVDGDVQLSPEGIHRLARHVIRTWIETGESSAEEQFDWRGVVPGIVRIRVAPEYVIWQQEGLTPGRAAGYFAGAVETTAKAIAGQSEGLIPLQDVLNKAAKMVGQVPAAERPFLVALHMLWTRAASPELRLASSEKVLREHSDLVPAGSLLAFIVDLATDRLDFEPWNHEALETLAEQRREALRRKPTWEIPRGVDAAVFACLAVHRANAGDIAGALDAVNEAITELPGDPQLLEMEQTLTNGGTDFLLGTLALLAPPEPGSST
jgi:hypothetical protein